MSFLQIPGNIKQQLLPFVLKSGGINKIVDSSDGLKDVPPQLFSYKNKEDYEKHPGGFGKLQFYPDAANVVFKSMNKDLSFQSLYGIDSSNKISKNRLTIDDIVNRIPCVQIREFIPDPRLQQAFNALNAMLGPLSKAWDLVKTIAKSGKIMDMVEFAYNYIIGTSEPNMWNDENGKDLQGFDSTQYDFDTYKPDAFKTDAFKYVMKFPFVMYYRLQTSVTTNIYEVPAMMNDNRIMSSDGTEGWFGQSGVFDIASIGKIFSSSMTGHIASLFNTIGVNYFPFWDPSKGRNSSGDSIVVDFDLFNDNVLHAITNFIFVNTIVPNNKWVQYNMFSHSSSLYDIKIEGLNRLFACAASIDVTYNGVLRDPSAKFINIIKSKHLNSCINTEKFMKSVVDDKLIKIPDTYHVKMTFRSLFPQNFNNFLYAFAQNHNHVTSYTKAYEDAEYTSAAEAFGKKIDALINAMKEKAEWDEIGDSISRSRNN